MSQPQTKLKVPAAWSTAQIWTLMAWLSAPWYPPVVAGSQGSLLAGGAFQVTSSLLAESSRMVCGSKVSPSAAHTWASVCAAPAQSLAVVGIRYTRCRILRRAAPSGPPSAASSSIGSSVAVTSASVRTSTTCSLNVPLPGGPVNAGSPSLSSQSGCASYMNAASFSTRRPPTYMTPGPICGLPAPLSVTA